MPINSYTILLMVLVGLIFVLFPEWPGRRRYRPSVAVLAVLIGLFLFELTV